jgi:hypothetical protein
MKINIEIVSSKDWERLGNMSLKITPLDVESAFQLGKLFSEIHDRHIKCSCASNESILIPLVNRDDLNIPIINKIVEDEPPF